jgi:hypothetical protein
MQVETRPRTRDEIKEIEARASYPIEVIGNELTNRSFSFSMDTGMYLSRVFLTNHPSLRWNQVFGNKKFVDYGQPVLVEFVTAPFNPVRMLVTLAYGIASKKETASSLRDLYYVWSKLIQ